MKGPIYLSVRDDRVVADLDSTKRGTKTVPLRDERHLLDLLIERGEDSVLCSSSLDFPEEYTKNADTIALCNKIRGA